MKRLLIPISSLAVLLVLGGMALAQRNPRGTAELSMNGKKTSVEYGRPSLNGRTPQQLLAGLKPGQVWRLGADKSTTFSTDTDLAFGDVTVPKGEYSIWARKEGEDSWKLVFNKQHGQWGAGPGSYDSAKDEAAVPLKQEKEDKSAEQLTIALENEAGGGEITIHWGTLELAAYFKAK
jgi:hypothetical protein